MGFFSFLNIVFFIEIVNHFRGGFPAFPVNGQLQLALLGPQHHGLAVHAAHHVERRLGLAAQGHLQDVFLDALLYGLFHLVGYLKVPVRGKQPADALVRPLVVVVSHPQPYPLTGLIKAGKGRAGQKLLENRGPEPLDFAQRHGMMGRGLDVMDAVAF
jgi:hypothetical protein